MNKLRRMIGMLGMMLGRPFGIRMQTCKESVELLADYFDGELPANEKRSIDLHVMACRDCENFTETYRHTGDLVRKLRYEDIPEDFRAHLKEILAQRLRGN